MPKIPCCAFRIRQEELDRSIAPQENAAVDKSSAVAVKAMLKDSGVDEA